MLTADNVTVYGGEVDSLQETGQQQLVSNKLYVSRFISSLHTGGIIGLAPIGGYITESAVTSPFTEPLGQYQIINSTLSTCFLGRFYEFLNPGT